MGGENCGAVFFLLRWWVDLLRNGGRQANAAGAGLELRRCLRPAGGRAGDSLLLVERRGGELQRTRAERVGRLGRAGVRDDRVVVPGAAPARAAASGGGGRVLSDLWLRPPRHAGPLPRMRDRG